MVAMIATPPAITGRADVTSVYLAHDAFTRDLRRLTEACLIGGAWTPRAATTWSTFTRRLGIHHRAEEEVLWPRLRTWGHPDLAALDDLASERAHIADATAAAHTAYGAFRITAFYDALSELGGRLGRYMCHDELLTLPLLARALHGARWSRRYRRTHLRDQSPQQ